MIADKKKFMMGIGLLASFIVVLAILFSPVFKGQNGLDYLDALYNSISKGSAYYVGEVKEAAAEFNTTPVQVKLEMDSELQAKQSAVLFEKANTQVQVAGATLSVSATMGQILGNCLEDADLMYNNEGTAVSAKYGMNERLALFNWHVALKAMEKDLNRQKAFKEAKMVALTVKKAVDLSYNYYQIEPKKITDSIGVVIFSLIFYVLYTLWFGFAILFLFEGWGMQLEH